jgi:hypothetical protein
MLFGLHSDDCNLFCFISGIYDYIIQRLNINELHSVLLIEDSLDVAPRLDVELILSVFPERELFLEGAGGRTKVPTAISELELLALEDIAHLLLQLFHARDSLDDASHIRAHVLKERLHVVGQLGVRRIEA